MENPYFYRLMQKLLQREKIQYIVLALFCIPLFFINIQDTHNYGDDWTQYLKEALNIAEGKPYYSSTYIFNPLNTEYAPPQYPPGYPLLMAPVVGITGMAIAPLLYLNTVFVCLIIFLAYGYLRRFTGGLNAMCLAIILAYIPAMTELKGALLSDIPCTLFTLLYFCLREQRQRWNLLKLSLLCIVAAFAILIRTQSAVIILAELSLLIWNFAGGKKHRNENLPRYYALLLAAGTVLLLALSRYMLFPGPGQSSSFYTSLYTNLWAEGKVWTTLSANMPYLESHIINIWLFPMHEGFFQAFVNFIMYSSLLLTFIGLTRMIREGMSLSLLFFLLMGILMVATPARQGLRYFLPAVPFALLLMAKGVRAVVPLFSAMSPQTIALTSFAAIMLLGFDNYEDKLRPNTDWSLQQSDTVAFNFIRRHVADSDIILFSKPRLLALYTEKRSMNFSWQHALAVNKRQFDSMGVRYVLYCRNISDKITTDYLWQEPRPYSDSTIINNDYTLYRLSIAP